MTENAVILLGFRGAGKSTVASLLAATTKVPVVDLDALLEQQTEMALPDFIFTQGEAKFRALEAAALQRALQASPPYILVPGGGVVDGEESLAILRASSLPKILLQCEAEVIWERIKHDPERLKVGGLTNLSDLKRLWSARQIKFRSLATFTVDSKDLSIAAAAVGKILHELS